MLAGGMRREASFTVTCSSKHGYTMEQQRVFSIMNALSVYGLT
jgi:hypothetical protein